MLFAVLLMGFSNWAYDDPYITYRYARNLITGMGFVYNPGEKVLSTTTPLFTLILALGGMVWPDIPRLAIIIGSASLVLGGIFFRSLADTWKRPLLGWTGLLLYPTFPLVVGTLGSEIPLYLAFCLGAYAFYVRKKFTPAAGMLALACLLRPDGVLVLLIMAVDHFAHGRRYIPWKGVLLFLGLVIPWLIFAWIYFGSPVPVTLAAKQHQGMMAISEQFSTGIFTILKAYRSWPFYLAAILMTSGLVYSIVKHRDQLVLFAWPAVYFVAYALLRVSRYFWYYAPLIPGIIGAVGSGISAFDETIRDISHRFGKSQQRIFRFASPLILMVLFLALLSYLWNMHWNPDDRYLAYRTAGEWINTNTLPDDRVGALEVGMIGYFADRSMIDFAGLLQPDVAQILGPQTTYEDSARWAIEHYQPDYLILHSGLFPGLEGDLVNKGCSIVNTIKGSDYQYRWDLKIYRCPE